MPKPTTPAPPVDSLFDSKPKAPETVSVEQAVESARTGTPIQSPTDTPPPQAPPPPPPQAERPPEPPPTSDVKMPVSFTPTNASEMYRYAAMLARAKLLPRGFYDRKDYEKKFPRIDDVHFVLLKGQALGLHPMTSIGNINIIDGKAEVGALLMVSMIRKSGLCKSWRLVESTDRRAVFSTQRIDEDDPTPFEYTIEEAELMGLLDKGRDEEAKAKNPWRLQPRTMLRRRCQSMLAREVYSDVVIGLYDYDELTEIRERAEALGMTEEQLQNAIPAVETRALPEGSGNAIESALSGMTNVPRGKAADPLMDRLKSRAAAAGGLIRRCSQCDTPLDPRDSDPCIACRPQTP